MCDRTSGFNRLAVFDTLFHRPCRFFVRCVRHRVVKGVMALDQSGWHGAPDGSRSTERSCTDVLTLRG